MDLCGLLILEHGTSRQGYHFFLQFSYVFLRSRSRNEVLHILKVSKSHSSPSDSRLNGKVKGGKGHPSPRAIANAWPSEVSEGLPQNCLARREWYTSTQGWAQNISELDGREAMGSHGNSWKVMGSHGKS